MSQEPKTRSVVQQFTYELTCDTTIKRATKIAQRDEGFTEEEFHRRRMQRLWRDEDVGQLDHEMEAEALALQKAYQLLEMDEASRRKPSRTAANSVLLSSTARDFQGLRAIVDRNELQWKAGQTRVGQRFRKVCQKLDDNKAVFAMFPSQNIYTSVLCGGLSLIVGAAANYNDIAERLSEMIADITDRASRAAKLLLVYKTRDMRWLCSDLYAQVFLFYREVIEWYRKSKVKKALESFNANMTKPYERAVARIEILITEIYREGKVAGSAQIAVLGEDIEDYIRDQRRQRTDWDDLVFAGRQAQRLLKAMGDSAERSNETPKVDGSSSFQRVESVPARDETGGPLNREEVRQSSDRLQRFVVGNDGPALFKNGKFWLPEPRIVSMLGEWIGSDALLSTLWIESPTMTRGFPGSRAAALTTVATAWDSELPIISHFCATPYHGDLPDGRTLAEVGLIGLVYSLILQLLQFNVEGDKFRTTKKLLESLDGSETSWVSALAMFKDLLQTTPQVTRCVIDGLNELSFSEGAEWSSAFLEALLEHQRISTEGFKILLTTRGGSRVLPDHIAEDDRAVATGPAREVIRDGQWIETTAK
ncbi:hypothetical protein E8E11_003619 [Didymella keratinophila]|nr:hypothetical protein E8E11_003619 [Didymella keratinophila]